MLGLCLKIVLIAGLTLATVSELTRVRRPDNPRMVIQGKTAREGMFPWTVSLYLNGRSHCTGSIISPTAILTAAHCVHQLSPGLFYAMAGSVDRRLGRRITFRRITIHPQYHDISLTNDIAVMQTTNPIIFGRRIQPICLSRRNPDGLVNRKVFIMGWGYFRRDYHVAPWLLQYDEQIIASTARCARIFGNYLPHTKACTGRIHKGFSGVCYGDSGGPLVYYENYRPVEVGVASSLENSLLGCGHPAAHDIFTRVASNIRFIRYTATGRICIM